MAERGKDQGRSPRSYVVPKKTRVASHLTTRPFPVANRNTRGIAAVATIRCVVAFAENCRKKRRIRRKGAGKVFQGTIPKTRTACNAHAVVGTAPKTGFNRNCDPSLRDVPSRSWPYLRPAAAINLARPGLHASASPCPPPRARIRRASNRKISFHGPLKN